MRAKGLIWVGTWTSRREEMVRFLRDVMGMRVEFEGPETAELSMTSGDRIQVFGPGHRYHEFFQQNARGPVPLFQVEDVGAAKAELEAAGAQIVGEPDQDDLWSWLHVRAPDGHLYEVASFRTR